MKTLTIVASVMLVALVGGIVAQLRPPARTAAPAPAREEPSEPPARPAPPPPTVDARPQLRRVVEEKRAELRTPVDVARYLDDLKVQARRNRQVTAFEVEPGIAAIRAHYEPEQAAERISEFAGEMARLSAELDGRDREVPAPDLDVIGRNLDRASGEAKQSLIREYLTGVRMLPPEERTQRLARLDQLVARP